MKDPMDWYRNDSTFKSVKNDKLGIELRAHEGAYDKKVLVYEGSRNMEAGLTPSDHYRLHNRVCKLASGAERDVLVLKKKLGIIN